jgi:hypothetical protein
MFEKYLKNVYNKNNNENVISTFEFITNQKNEKLFIYNDLSKV